MARGSTRGERRGGRQKGTPNRNTVILRDILNDKGCNPALSLVRIAEAAEERKELALAADCYGKLANLIYPKPRPVELNPDALVELEGRIAEARTRGMVKEGLSPFDGLGERLARAYSRVAEQQRQADNPAAVAQQPTATLPAPVDPTPHINPVQQASPTSPVQRAAHPGDDWTAPQQWPASRQTADFTEMDYDAMSDCFVTGTR